MKFTTKKLVTLALLCAVAYVLAYVFSLMGIAFIPAAPFLHYDPKDIIIVLSGFLFGAPSVVIMSAAVSLLELFTISRTGFFGCIMNFISSCAFAGTAVVIYRFKKNFISAVTGLAAGCIVVTGVMLFWNWLIVPLYTENISREQVAAMLIPYFMPFNLIKGGINAGLTLAVYKPVKLIFEKAKID